MDAPIEGHTPKHGPLAIVFRICDTTTTNIRRSTELQYIARSCALRPPRSKFDHTRRRRCMKLQRGRAVQILTNRRPHIQHPPLCWWRLKITFFPATRNGDGCSPENRRWRCTKWRARKTRCWQDHYFARSPLSHQCTTTQRKTKNPRIAFPTWRKGWLPGHTMVHNQCVN